MKKVYRKLTKDQEKRGIVFSSCLSKYTEEMQDDTIHELTGNEEDYNRRERLLLDDSFFNGSPWNYNIIRK